MNLFDFHSRRLELMENARAASGEDCERQLVTAQAAAEFRLIDFLAEGFAELERRWRATPLEQKVETIWSTHGQTPEQYGESLAPYFVDILKEVLAKRQVPRPETFEEFRERILPDLLPKLALPH